MKKGFLLIISIVIISAIMLTLLGLVSFNLAAQRRVAFYQQTRQQIYNQRSAASRAG